MTRTRHVALRLVRWLFFLLSFAYLAHFAYTSFDLQDVGRWFAPESALHLLLSTVVFATTAAFSVLGWRILLAKLGHPTGLTGAATAVCLTQIAKYLPGNVGHHVGRVTLAKMRLDVPSATGVISILQEGAIACLAAILFGCLCILMAPADAFTVLQRQVHVGLTVSMGMALQSVLILGLLALTMVNVLRYRLGAHRPPALQWLLKITPSWPAVLASLPCYLAINALNGVAVWLVADSLTTVGAADLLILAGAYAIAWIIGFLLPGAPGGLGVREAALAMLLGGSYSPDIIFSLSVLSRLSTVLADLLIFAVGVTLSRLCKQPTLPPSATKEP